MRSDAITAVTVTPASGSTTTVSPSIDSYTGIATYTSPNLAEGSYKLSYSSLQHFVNPPAQTVTVKSGETTAVPLLLVPFATNDGSVSFAVNGKSTSAVYVNGSYTGSIFTLIATGYEGTVLLMAQPTSTPNSYTLTGSFGASPRSRTHTVTTGTLVITSKDEVNRRVSGTFSVTGTANNGSGTSTVTNGVFTDLMYW
jgi:hypothetical protein